MSQMNLQSSKRYLYKRRTQIKNQVTINTLTFKKKQKRGSILGSSFSLGWMGRWGLLAGLLQHVVTATALQTPSWPLYATLRSFLVSKARRHTKTLVLRFSTSAHYYENLRKNVEICCVAVRSLLSSNKISHLEALQWAICCCCGYTFSKKGLFAVM